MSAVDVGIHVNVHANVEACFCLPLSLIHVAGYTKYPISIQSCHTYVYIIIFTYL